MSSTSLPWQPDPLFQGINESDGRDAQEKAPPAAKTTETTPGGREAIQWENVAETMGLLPAQIIAGRLRSEGIPARAWQESVGVVHGLTVGPMGTGYVSVPQEFVEQALDILAGDVDNLDEDGLAYSDYEE